MIAVIDTNVLVSGIIVPVHAPGKILNLMDEEILEPALDARIWAEYCDVLNREYFKKYFPPHRKEQVLEHIMTNGYHVASTVTVSDLPDPKDVCFLEVALQTGAPLVTGNLKHFPAKLCCGAPVFTPTEFLKEFFHA